jgi:hypothetical protein
MRVKSNWFRGAQAKTPQQNASAVAFIAWRVADNALKNMRRADFDIAVGPQYFEFLSEFLIFLVVSADRIAYRRMSAEDRVTFTSAVANRAGEMLADNWSELLGGEMAAHKAAFIDRLNQRAGEYAEYEYGEDSPGFSFLRHFGYALQGVMDERDKAWVIDQVMAIDAPEAVATLEKAVRGLFDDERPRRRSSVASAQ